MFESRRFLVLVVRAEPSRGVARNVRGAVGRAVGCAVGRAVAAGIDAAAGRPFRRRRPGGVARGVGVSGGISPSWRLGRAQLSRPVVEPV